MGFGLASLRATTIERGEFAGELAPICELDTTPHVFAAFEGLEDQRHGARLERDDTGPTRILYEAADLSDQKTLSW